jgi:hypothetical protein
MWQGRLQVVAREEGVKLVIRGSVTRSGDTRVIGITGDHAGLLVTTSQLTTEGQK